MSKLRFVTIIPVICSFFGSLLMFYVGAVKTVKAFRVYLLHGTAGSERIPSYLDFSEQATILVVEAVDAFLLGLVLLVFSIGVYTLFIGELKLAGAEERFAWMRIHSIEKLKKVLMEVVLVVLAVLFLRVALYEAENLEWVLLVLPTGIALLALTIKLVGWPAASKTDED
jgi:uncharacterized membrane protein YqhA